MPFLPIILVAEIIFASFTLSFPKQPKDNVLGVQLAQLEDSSQSNPPPPAESSQTTNPPTDNPPSQNTPQTEVSPLDSSQPTTGNTQASQNSSTSQESSSGLNPQNQPNEVSTSNNSSSPYDTNASSDNPSYFNDIINSPSTNETAQPTDAESQTSSEQPTSIETTIQPTNPQVGNESSQTNQETETVPTPIESYPNQTASVLDPNDLLNSVENINQQSIDEAKKEEDQISQTADPADQTKLLINFAADKVKDVNNSIKNDDFASTNFASQRFNEQIDQAVDNLQNLPPEKSRQLQKQLVNFCSQTDYVLKTAELSVPEEAEQDLEINRAKCLSLQP